MKKDNMRILWIGNFDPEGYGRAYAYAINRFTNHECRVYSFNETIGFDGDLIINRRFFSGLNLRPPEFWFGELGKLLKWANLIVLNFDSFNVTDKRQPEKFEESLFKINNVPVNKIFKDMKKEVCAFFSGSEAIVKHKQFFIKYCRRRNWPILTNQTYMYKMFSKHIKTHFIIPLITMDHPLYRNSMFSFISKKSFNLKELTACYSLDGMSKNSIEIFSNSIVKVGEKHKKNVVSGIGYNRMSFIDLISRKKQHHIGFDGINLKSGSFSRGSLDNMALGLINIVYISDDTKSHIIDFIGELPPWEFVSSEEELVDVFHNLYEDRKNLYDRMYKSYIFMRERWNDSDLIHRVVNIIEKTRTN